ncbi:unnamed protein product [Prorocentrum cordatum]|uniref:Uncharacterized protein n=1 Tax=Prorocentrum cordatum TaxID=2364126 RepID=A0ABN9QHK4_9DINO|nr:unnamed protein product [Polarella glacialis]
MARASTHGAPSRASAGMAAADGGTPRVVFNRIEVPRVVLTADDADPGLYVPSPRASLEDCEALAAGRRRMLLRAPPGVGPGSVLRLPPPATSQGPQAGTALELEFPRNAAPGDALFALERPDGTWRLQKRTDEFAFLLPDCKPGDTLRARGLAIAPPNKEWAPVEDQGSELIAGTFLSFLVPDDIGHGELISVRLVEGADGGAAWALERLLALPPAANIAPPRSEPVRGPYAAALGLLERRGLLRHLVPDGDGVLQVNAPFCGRFQEHALLADLLSRLAARLPSARRVRLLGVEASAEYYQEWALAEKWMREAHPRVELSLRVGDLSEEALPAAALTIGLHPEVTKGGPWFAIVGSAVRSTRGLLMFATFYEDEMETVVNMANMYKSESSFVEAIENPYYHGMAELPPSPRMRYLVLVHSGRAAHCSRSGDASGDGGKKR